MSEQERFMTGEISPTTGEVMISAEDVVAWLRRCSDSCTDPSTARYVQRMGDVLAGNWIEAAAEAMERGA